MTIDSKKNAIKYAKKQTWYKMPKPAPAQVPSG